MDLRRELVVKVRGGEMNISQAARHYHLERATVKAWLRRADEVGLADLSEHSRRPHKISVSTDTSVVEQVLRCKAERPAWGAKKIVAVLWKETPPICVRTADRILKRHGLVQPRKELPKASGRFEREYPNELWQMDFKGLAKHTPYSPLTVLDDASRFCLGLLPLPNHWSVTIFDALWEVFDAYGMPLTILSDNEPCFADWETKGLSWLEARLLLLGIRMIHGRRAHPQTQGKVERIHKTFNDELGQGLYRQSVQEAQAAFQKYLIDYNYVRPHESLEMRCPGAVYSPSVFKRPDKLPAHEIPSGSISRKVDANGKFWFKATKYRAGHGLAGQYVEIREGDIGYKVAFADFEFAHLEGLKA